MSGWTIAWLVWGGLFAVIEYAAILNDAKGDTLSEHFREWFDTDTHHGRTLWLVASGVFFAWFTVHIAVAGAA